MAGISPSYRIGPSDFFDGSDLKADGATLNDQVNRLNDMFYSGAKVSDDLWNAWADFVPAWRTFYSGTIGSFFVAWNDSNRDELIQYEQRFINFASDFSKQTGREVYDVTSVSTGAQDTLGQHLLNQVKPLAPAISSAMWYVIAAIAIGAVIFFGGRYFLKKAIP